ncbi:TetR family transcriptional regulator [soil metagenome]
MNRRDHSMDAAPAPVRRRDSAATRQALLDAARELFGTHGFDQTTLRDIGERAGVDASLIARYFGNKVALYLAAAAADAPAPFDPSGPLAVDALVLGALGRIDVVGMGPIVRALLQPGVDEEIRAASTEYLQRRVIQPLAQRLDELGVEQAALRAEIVISAMMGVLAVRAGSSLPEIASADREVLTRQLTELLNRMLELR